MSLSYKELFERYRPILLPSLSALGFLIIWEIVGWLAIVWRLGPLADKINPLFFSYPSDITIQAIDLVRTGELLRHFLVSANEFARGFSLAVFIAIPLGLILGLSKDLSYSLTPFIMGMYATPMVAVAPLMVMWFGIGISAKTLIIFLFAFFPICINNWEGVKTVDRTLVDAARSFGATKLQILRRIVLPATLPFTITGLRLAVGMAIKGIFVAELWGSTAGLGYMIVNASYNYRTAELFVGMLSLGVTSIILTETVKFLERKLAPWIERQKRW